MAQLSILYWRDIPSQVVVKQGRKNAKVLLSERFQVAIDMAAMRDGSHETDAYLEGWRKGTAEPVDGDMQEAADTAANAIESSYDKDVVKRLVANGGRETDA
ncbi:virulence factor [Sneathiella marina]|uniref:Virulence factor n=1 Tax=Sneathiella marina TaxID=2950108 RepID=A0ABY4W723_9PROT|nr:virulence factor [Sneathiella marina]USG62991.1 virulence factor [Sneathiella marina]